MTNLEKDLYYGLPDSEKLWLELTHRAFRTGGIIGLIADLENEVKRTRKFVEQLLTQLPRRPKIVVDIGGGYGGTAINFALRGITTKIVEPSERERRWEKYLLQKYPKAKKHLKILNAASEKLPLQNESADLVIFIEVLEHVSSLDKSVKELSRILVSGGHAFVSCPNYLYPMEQHYHLPYFPLMSKKWFSRWAFFLMLTLNKNKRNLKNRDTSKIRKAIFSLNYMTDSLVLELFQKNNLKVEWSARTDDISLAKQLKKHLKDNPVKNFRELALLFASIPIKLTRVLLANLGFLPRGLQYLVTKVGVYPKISRPLPRSQYPGALEE